MSTDSDPNLPRESPEAIAAVHALGWRHPLAAQIRERLGPQAVWILQTKDVDAWSLALRLLDLVEICRYHQSPATQEAVAHSLALLARLTGVPTEFNR